MKIQFCQADKRPKIRVSGVSFGPNRKLASRPVSASGDCAARDSIAWRISSSQSRSSGAAVTRPASRASRGESFRSEEHTSELQSLRHLVCRLLLEKKK